MNRPLGIIAANKGLSLNDCFWVDAEGSGDTFEKVNLYDNRFSQVLAGLFALAVVWISKQGGWKGEGCGGNCASCHQHCDTPEKKTH